jgi:RNA polymerase sigma factor (sigma-70 family)
MPRFHKVAEEIAPDRGGELREVQRTGLDERFLADFITENPLDRVEGQELRQIFLAALEKLTPDEMKVVEMRFQRKKSQGQTASRLRMDREAVAALENSAVEKLRGPIGRYMES